MDGIGRLCVRCQAQLGPGARFCPQCGLRAGAGVPAATAFAATAEDQPPGPAAAGGSGATIAAALAGGPGAPAKPWPSRPLRDPLPTGPPDEPAPSAASMADTRCDLILPAAPPAAPPPADQPSAYRPPAYPPPYPPPPDHQPAGPVTAAQPVAVSAPPYPPPGGPPGGPPRQPPRRHDRNRSGSSLTWWILLSVLLIGGAAASVVAEHPFSHLSAADTGGAAGGTATGSAAPAAISASASPVTSSSLTSGPSAGATGSGTGAPASGGSTAPPPAAVPRQQAAAGLATLLSQSIAARAAIIRAAADVADCGPGLDADPQAFQDVAASRQSLLASLSALPGRTALPAGLLSDLTGAWQASVSADQAYARWATDEISKGCVRDDTGDPAYQAAQVPDQSATRDKTAFAAAWNQIAASYGLTQYQPGQL